MNDRQTYTQLIVRCRQAEDRVAVLEARQRMLLSPTQAMAEAGRIALELHLSALPPRSRLRSPSLSAIAVVTLQAMILVADIDPPDHEGWLQ